MELLKQEKGQLCRAEDALSKDRQLQLLQQTVQGMQQVPAPGWGRALRGLAQWAGGRAGQVPRGARTVGRGRAGWGGHPGGLHSGPGPGRPLRASRRRRGILELKTCVSGRHQQRRWQRGLREEERGLREGRGAEGVP